MTQTPSEAAPSRSTRAGFLRAAFAGGAVAAGGVAIGARGGGSSRASGASRPSRAMDAEILNLFLTLERAQEDFYRAALAGDVIDGPLRDFATAAAGQEREHIAFLTRHLGSRAHAHRPVDPGPAVQTPARFRRGAIALEEAAIAAYIGQSANLTPPMVAAVAPLVSVEARQVAWIRDLEGITPAPRAADPGRPSNEVLADLRAKGLVA